jgi:hypothetical protein
MRDSARDRVGAAPTSSTVMPGRSNAAGGAWSVVSDRTSRSFSVPGGMKARRDALEAIG